MLFFVGVAIFSENPDAIFHSVAAVLVTGRQELAATLEIFLMGSRRNLDTERTRQGLQTQTHADAGMSLQKGTCSSWLLCVWPNWFQIKTSV